MSNTFVIKNAQIFQTETRSFITGAVLVEDGKIGEIITDGKLPENVPVTDAEGKYLVPGLVDVHTHGRLGFDFDSATAEQMREMRASYAGDGTTTVLPTIASAPMENIENGIDRIKEVGFDGMHLEGRYMNAKRRGAHRLDLLFPLDKEELSGLLDRMGSMIVHITCAAELEGGEAFVKTAVGRGATVSIGHSDASYEEAIAAFSNGVTGLTHTFNAMRPIQHRDPGPIVAGFTEPDIYCEIIADGFHLAPATVKLTYQVKKPDHLVLITDSMCATRCCDGEYAIAGQKVFVKDGKAINEEGNIAGSTITLYTAVLNLMKFAGASFEDAIACATINPARMVGLDKITGSIEVGKRADLLIVEPKTYTIKAIYAAGESVGVTYSAQ